MRALVGGPQPAYRGVGLRLHDASTKLVYPISPDARPSHRDPVVNSAWAEVRRRAERSMRSPTAIEQAYPLRAIDQERIGALGRLLSTCLPELSRLPRSEVSATLLFDEGHVNQVSVTMDGRPSNSLADFRRCVDATTAATRLRAHRERISIQFRWERSGVSSSR
jgi:hypothetical protein